MGATTPQIQWMSSRRGCVACARPATWVLRFRVFGPERRLGRWWPCAFCAACEPDLDTFLVDGVYDFNTPRRSAYMHRREVQRALDLSSYEHVEFLDFERLRCRVCDVPGRLTGGVCVVCRRLQHQYETLHAPMLDASRQSARALRKLHNAIVASRLALAPPFTPESSMVAASSSPASSSPASSRARLQTEVEDGLWGAGAEALTETVRDTLIEVLASDLPTDEQAAAQRVLRRCLQTRAGTVIVAATAGGVVYLGQTYDMQFPLFDPDTVTRLGREFRVLAVRAGAKTLFDKFIGPFRDVAIANFGGVLRGLSRATEKVTEARAIRAQRDAAPHE